MKYNILKLRDNTCWAERQGRLILQQYSGTPGDSLRTTQFSSNFRYLFQEKKNLKWNWNTSSSSSNSFFDRAKRQFTADALTFLTDPCNQFSIKEPPVMWTTRQLVTFHLTKLSSVRNLSISFKLCWKTLLLPLPQLQHYFPTTFELTLWRHNYATVWMPES